MKNWQAFLDSLSTSGGNLFILVTITACLSPLVIHVLHDPNVDATIRTMIHDTFVGFTGALLYALKGNSSRQQMQDRVDTADDSDGSHVGPPGLLLCGRGQFRFFPAFQEHVILTFGMLA
jgi:hypothetical protein